MHGILTSVTSILTIFYIVKSLLLNAELVSMFDPIKTEELEKVVFECQACAEKMEQMKKQDIEQLSTSQ